MSARGRLERRRGDEAANVRLRRRSGAGRRLRAGMDGRHVVRSRVVQFPQVFLEIEVPTEPFAAHVTRERFLVVVRVHVKRQIVHLRENETPPRRSVNIRMIRIF